MLITKVDIDLDPPIKYVCDGHTVEATKMALHAPTMRHIQYASKIKQSILRSCMDAAKGRDNEEDTKNDSKITGATLLFVLQSSNCDIEEVFADFKKLITSGLATMDDSNVELSGVMYDKLSLEQCEFIFGEYVENFLMGSLMKNQ